ncbi:tetratricopeptide repeat protein [Azospirillum griseum]|uniref:Tetratricopeptide repeat protein n=2 Tax=Azospirillum griseum TaxID=2496639 RepID=A0A431VNU9_9PROT|nr:tetratricopeptide repeat-containing glycosyltransferase family protein [Azospirillum griseum]RTR24442.1 tetratricopeptide repeat protein [Azospirillum griseum]
MTDTLTDALRLHQSGRLAEAADLYAALLRANPLHADALHLLGILRAQQGGPVRDAVALIGQAAALNPTAASYRGNLGKAVRGDWPAAAAGLRDAGDALYDHGQPGIAARAYRAAALIQPDDPLAWGNLAVATRDQGAPGDAVPPIRRASALDPANAAITRLAASLLLDARHPAADAAIRRAIADAPADAALRRARADAAKIAGDRPAAEALYRTALTLDPAEATAWFHLGVVLGDQGRHGDSVPAYARAVRLDPAAVDPRYNLAHAQLITGDWRAGWESFAVRFARGVALPAHAPPRWRGEPLTGQTLLFYGEQGHGDAIQMIRYAPLIARAGGRVVVECLPALVRLFAEAPGVSAAVPLGSAPKADWLCPMMDAPGLFATTPDRCPNAVPYLRPPADARKPELPDDPARLTVGLVWAGDPHRDDARWSHADTRRSLPLSGFAPLFDHPRLRLVSLQKGSAAAQADAPPFAGRLWTRDIAAARDFADTAALVQRLDLVISVDTAVAHLAGALGVPVWVLSRFDGCWRWLLDRDDSPWYPTVRLFRQPTLGEDWTPVLDAVAAALDAAVDALVRARATTP